MSGPTTNYKKYHEYLKKMSDPIMPSKLPRVKINFQAIAKYAKENGICIADLDEAEKKKIVDTIGGVVSRR